MKKKPDPEMLDEYDFSKGVRGKYARPWYNEAGGKVMTTLLQQAFTEAAKLPTAEQDLLASRLLAELAAEDDFDRAISRTSDKLAGLAREAIAEHRAGRTEELDPERL